jgi:hypothetical protein
VPKANKGSSYRARRMERVGKQIGEAMVRTSLGPLIGFGALLACLIVLASPSPSEAGVLGFRNDTNTPVIVQVMILVNNVPVRGTRQILMPGKFYTEAATPGNKQVIIADARQPTRILYNGAMAPAMNDQLFSIKEVLIAPKIQPGRQRQILPRVELEQIQALKPPAVKAPPAPRRPQGR